MLAPIVNFDELWSEAAVVTIGGIEVRIASIPHLIRMTGNGRTHFQNRRRRAPWRRARTGPSHEAAGRTQDLADVERLRVLQQRGKNR